MNGLNYMLMDSHGIHASYICKCHEVCASTIDLSPCDCTWCVRSQLFGGITILWTSTLCVILHGVIKNVPRMWCSPLKKFSQKLFSKHNMKWKSIGFIMVNETKEGKERTHCESSWNLFYMFCKVFRAFFAQLFGMLARCTI